MKLFTGMRMMGGTGASRRGWCIETRFSQPSYMQVPHLWIQPTSDQRIFGKQIPETSEKQNLILPCAGNYLYSIYIVLSIMSNQEMI